MLYRNILNEQCQNVYNICTDMENENIVGLADVQPNRYAQPMDYELVIICYSECHNSEKSKFLFFVFCSWN